MSFLGKILIVTQVVLSLLFMCAAGAVFALHVNWRDEARKQEAQVSTLQTQHSNEVANLNQRIDALTTQMQTQTNRADQEVGTRQRLEQEVAALRQETNSLNQQLQRQTGLAETKSNEAAFRQAEAERIRAQNNTLSRTIDELNQKNVQLEDQLGTRNQAYEELVQQHDRLLEQVAFLERVVRQHKLETDPRVVASYSEPPPPVEGVVQDVRKDQANRPKFVHITIGSDDGLRVGHQLDVYRPAERSNGKAAYLGRIRIWSVTPNEAVGLVIESARNGIIEVGDNVTTKL